jgi:DNA-binding MarR family transcriptional regulator
MKSAYELAMSRLEKSTPAVSLTDEQKAKLAEVDSEVNARIAEKKIFLEDQIAKASPQEREEIRRQLVSEIARLEEKREREKDKVRNAG